MLSTARNIYDPPPAPEPLSPPAPEPLRWARGDLGVLACLVVAVLSLAAWAWTIEPMLAALALIGGTIVIVESWSTALTFLHRRPWAGVKGRWKIFLAALVPWLLILSLATALMVGLFSVLDRIS